MTENNRESDMSNRHIKLKSQNIPHMTENNRDQIKSPESDMSEDRIRLIALLKTIDDYMTKYLFPDGFSDEISVDQELLKIQVPNKN
jgi:hypothetical protein